MPDETTQPDPEPVQPQPSPEATSGNAETKTQIEPVPTGNPISESNSVPPSSQEPIPYAPIPPTESAPAETLPEASQTSTNPEDAPQIKDDISANEPLNQSVETVSIEQEPQKTETNPEPIPAPEPPKNPPETAPQQPTAQMAGNEPIDLAEEIKIKQRQENLKLANEMRQEKKRNKIDAILDLFAKQTNLTNDEVEKLLHVSDATATRYLETLEKEGKIKQVGKTGKGVKYEKI